MFLIDIMITCFIKYELDEFELHCVDGYVWYDVVYENTFRLSSRGWGGEGGEPGEGVN